MYFIPLYESSKKILFNEEQSTDKTIPIYRKENCSSLIRTLKDYILLEIKNSQKL